MEYMRLDGFLGRTVAKLINKAIKSKVGHDPNIMLDFFNLKADNGLVTANVTLSMSQQDFEDLFEEVTK